MVFDIDSLVHSLMLWVPLPSHKEMIVRVVEEKGGADSDGGGGAGGRVWRVNDREAYIKDKMEKS